jgi:hypothetical protein
MSCRTSPDGPARLLHRPFAIRLAGTDQGGPASLHMEGGAGRSTQMAPCRMRSAFAAQNWRARHFTRLALKSARAPSRCSDRSYTR